MSPCHPQNLEGSRSVNVQNKTGIKRQHAELDCSDSCDCEEFGLPLSKRINRLQLEQQQEAMQGALLGVGLQHQHGAVVQHATPPANDQQLSGGPNFAKSYPFPSESAYFNANQLLASLYAERIRRHPRLAHVPD